MATKIVQDGIWTVSLNGPKPEVLGSDLLLGIWTTYGKPALAIYEGDNRSRLIV